MDIYRHVLSGLQAIPKNHPVPFEKYFVNCSPDVGKPKYLEENKVPVVFTSLTEGQRSVVTDVFDLQKWPTKEQLGLDQSQLEALQLALTSELALIQGPPGTGKTFLGHQLSKLLLANEFLWNAEKKHPILVVCFTNHALDQFLEGIIEFTTPDDIVRIGGQSKNEKLMECSLRNHRVRKHDLVPKDLRFEIDKLRFERNRLENQINYITTTFVNIQQKGLLLNSTGLKNVINEEHAIQLFKGRIRNDRLLLQWLTAIPNHTTDNKNQRINVPLVRKLMMDYDVSEVAAKIALSRTGNKNVGAAYNFLLDNMMNPGLLRRDNGTSRWPALQDVNAMMRRGFTEQDAVTALEIHGSMKKASAGLERVYWPGKQESVKKKGSSNGSVMQTDQKQNESGATIASENAEGDDKDVYEEDNKDNEDDFLFLDEEFFSAFFDSSFSSRSVQDEAGVLFFPTHQIKHQNHEELYKWPELLIHLEQFRPFILSTDPLSEMQMGHVGNVWKQPIAFRWKIYNYWVNKQKKQLLIQLKQKSESYSDVLKQLRSLTSMSDLVVLRSAKVIGMTTTGAAQNQALLRSIQPRIVIMEEAAEVLEAHLITSLSDGCQHVILIGDHQQLRPNISLYKLSKHFNFDISLFERLINNNFKHAMLKIQHRMRPEISRTLMPHFYPDLLDHPTVKEFEDVQGIEKNMIFLDHTCPETQDLDSKSHLNHFEAQMAVGLSSHLLKQDYKVTQITVLCAYMDQMITIKKLMKEHHLEEIRVTVVDNYQGEECDIIILSLVRSNSEGKIGFLKVKNRVCVALSRAKRGFYCLGNFSHLVDGSYGSDTEDNVMPWPVLVQDLDSSGFLRKTIPIVCLWHGERQEIAKFKDFQLMSPEGGCHRPCDTRLECGHVCEKPCHAYDPEHKQIPCSKPCGRYCSSSGEHLCKKLCSKVCGNCLVTVSKELLCGHIQEVPCYITVDMAKCNEKCTKTLPCGHPCMNKCSDKCTSECKKIVTKTLPCGHSDDVACFLKVEKVLCSHKVVKSWPHCGHEVLTKCHVDPTTTPCKNLCAQPLPDCEHLCQGTCGSCRRGRLHVQCSNDCRRILICGHECTSHKCGRPCPPCEKTCETQCVHSKCVSGFGKHKKGRRCGERCPLCIENCGWACIHEGCHLRCYEPCKRKPCTEPCQKTLKCGTKKEPHHCIGICGEPCPKLCFTCDPHEKIEEVKEIFFGTEDEPDARFIQLEDCGHILEMTGIDNWIKTQTESEDGKTAQAIEMLSCPKCKKPIRKSMRFGKYLKQRMLDIEKIKQKVYGETPDALEAQRYKLFNRVSQFMKKLLDDVNNESRKDDPTKRSQVKMLPKESISRYARIAGDLQRLIGKPEIRDLTQNKIDCWSNIRLFMFKLGTFELYDLTKFRASYHDAIVTANTKHVPQLTGLCNQFFDSHLPAFLENEHKLLLDWLVKNKNSLLSQTMMDQFSCEIQRLSLLAQVCTVIFSAFKIGPSCRLQPKNYEDMTQLLISLNGQSSINEQIEERCKTVVAEWLKVVDLAPGTGISWTERAQIVKAMGFRPGHWYKCPQGHIYAIGDCGGASQESKCPVCGSRIGGAGHQLTSGNTRADRIMLDQDLY